MSQVITFENFRPSPRYDGNPWTSVTVEEGSAAIGPWTTIDTIAISPVDADPTEPATRNFTTENASDTPELWYRLTFTDADGDFLLPTYPIQNLSETLAVYASVTELARILKIRTPTSSQLAAMQRVLAAASGEINAEIDLATDVTLESWQRSLAEEVALERAVEHWRQQEAPFGLIGLGAEFGGGAERTARDSWERHAHKLAPLKSQWGLA